MDLRTWDDLNTMKKKQMGNNYISILIFSETKIGKFDFFF